MKLLFKTQWKLLVFLAALFLFFWLVYSLRNILFPFVLGFILAYILLPFIQRMEKRFPKDRFLKIRRVSLISSTYVVFIVIFTALSILTINTVKPVLANISIDAPDYWNSVYNNLINSTESVTDILLNFLPAGLHQQIDQYIYDFGLQTITTFTKNFSGGNMPVSFSSMGMVIGIITMPVFLFYLLKDWEKLGKSFYSSLTPGISVHARRIAGIIDHVMGRFIRAELVLGLVVGTLTLIGLLILNIPFAVVLAIVAGIGETVPTFGPWISAIIAVFVTLALVPDKAIWVIILFGGVQLLENIFLVPRIQGGFLGIHPAIALVLLIIGSYIAGVWGILLILPLTATIKEIIKYVNHVLDDEKNKEIPPEPTI
jgi:predicted PurR-regulated permease PerM